MHYEPVKAVKPIIIISNSRTPREKDDFKIIELVYEPLNVFAEIRECMKSSEVSRDNWDRQRGLRMLLEERSR